MTEPCAVNRANWNERAAIHARDRTGYYMVDRFLAGEDTLSPIEAAEIGDVAGIRLLHLQCHIGLDTLSLARRGADVTGLDFSSKAISLAHDFARRTRIGARFVEADVYDTPAAAGRDFDLVYTTWGTIVWLPDVFRWARTVATALRPGGRLYFLDYHPGLHTLEEEAGRLVARHRWRTTADTPVVFEGSQTYTGDEMPPTARVSYEWAHPLGDIIQALIEAGLAIETIHEHDHLPDRWFPMMVEAGARVYRLPPDQDVTPLALSIRANKA